MIEGVIFDIGGVLARDVWEYFLPSCNNAGGIRDKFGLDKEEIEKLGTLLWAAFAHTPESPTVTWRDLERRYWELFVNFFWPNGKGLPAGASVEAFIEMTDEYIKLIDPDVPNLLRDLLGRGITLGVCSNNNEFWFRRQFSHLSLAQYFSPSKVVLSCRVGASKSSKNHEMFHAAIEAMKIHPSRCLFVDDRCKNLERAREVGLQGIHFEDFSKFRTYLNGALGG